MSVESKPYSQLVLVCFLEQKCICDQSLISLVQGLGYSSDQLVVGRAKFPFSETLISPRREMSFFSIAVTSVVGVVSGEVVALDKGTTLAMLVPN